MWLAAKDLLKINEGEVKESVFIRKLAVGDSV